MIVWLQLVAFHLACYTRSYSLTLGAILSPLFLLEQLFLWNWQFASGILYFSWGMYFGSRSEWCLVTIASFYLCFCLLSSASTVGRAVLWLLWELPARCGFVIILLEIPWIKCNVEQMSSCFVKILAYRDRKPWIDIDRHSTPGSYERTYRVVTVVISHAGFMISCGHLWIACRFLLLSSFGKRFEENSLISYIERIAPKWC